MLCFPFVSQLWFATHMVERPPSLMVRTIQNSSMKISQNTMKLVKNTVNATK